MSKKKYDQDTGKELLHYLSGFVTPRRFELFNTIAGNRTRYITLALENVYQSHNASAVLRTCDCFGIQDVHIIENSNPYEVNPDVALGASQWLNLFRYNSGEESIVSCISQLRKKGYRIVATTPHHQAISLNDFDVTAGKFALLFGTEKEGLSGEAIALSDEKVKIPMFGFTESFNISVSAALFLFHLSASIRQQGIHWQLSDEEILEIQLEWLQSSIKGSDEIVKRFLEKKY